MLCVSACFSACKFVSELDELLPCSKKKQNSAEDDSRSAFIKAGKSVKIVDAYSIQDHSTFKTSSVVKFVE